MIGNLALRYEIPDTSSLGSGMTREKNVNASFVILYSEERTQQGVLLCRKRFQIPRSSAL